MNSLLSAYYYYIDIHLEVNVKLFFSRWNRVAIYQYKSRRIHLIEIIPNWHPIFVHFTVALVSIAVAFYVLAYLAARSKIISNQLIAEFATVGQWCLWVGGFITILTILAGFYAFNTVNHDEPAHLAMLDHRKWALWTATAIILVGLWSGWRHYNRKKLTLMFVFALLIVQALLLSTAWRGGELVYRHGLGVMSLPKSEGQGHHHHHEAMTPNQSNTSSTSNSNEQEDTDHHEHNNNESH